MSSLLLLTSTVRDGNMSFRYGEYGEVLKNRERFLAKHNISPSSCVTMNLQNGTECAVVASNDKGHGMTERNGIEADCLITSEKNLFLFLLIGDCLPVALYDPVESVVALAHIGRHNADKEFVASIVMKLETEFGSKPQNLIVNIGPGIHKESYIQSDSIPQISKEAWQPFLTKYSNKVALDLPGFIANQLSKKGLLDKNIRISPIDTASSKEYFSHCRSAHTSEPEGRFAVVAGMDTYAGKS